jgi:hypothetical protein
MPEFVYEIGVWGLAVRFLLIAIGAMLAGILALKPLARLRVFSGTGRLLVCWTPYWNEHLYQRMTGGDSISGSLLE